MDDKEPVGKAVIFVHGIGGTSGDDHSIINKGNWLGNTSKYNGGAFQQIDKVSVREREEDLFIEYIWHDSNETYRIKRFLGVISSVFGIVLELPRITEIVLQSKNDIFSKSCKLFTFWTRCVSIGVFVPCFFLIFLYSVAYALGGIHLQKGQKPTEILPYYAMIIYYTLGIFLYYKYQAHFNKENELIKNGKKLEFIGIKSTGSTIVLLFLYVITPILFYFSATLYFKTRSLEHFVHFLAGGFYYLYTLYIVFFLSIFSAILGIFHSSRKEGFNQIWITSLLCNILHIAFISMFAVIFSAIPLHIYSQFHEKINPKYINELLKLFPLVGIFIFLVVISFLVVQRVYILRHKRYKLTHPSYGDKARNSTVNTIYIASMIYLFLLGVVFANYNTPGPVVNSEIIHEILNNPLIIYGLLLVSFFITPFFITPLEFIRDVLWYVSCKLSRDKQHLFSYKCVDNLKSIINILTDLKYDIIIVAHSQGTVVSYDTLRSINSVKTPNISLITLGSPLNSLYAKFFPEQMYPKELTIPNIVKSWSNYFFAGDYVGTILRSKHIKNECLEKGTHTDYWGHEKVAEKIKEHMSIKSE